MADSNTSMAVTPTSPGTKGAVIAPAASDLDPIPKGVVLLTAGDVTIVPALNEIAGTLAFVGLPAGYVIPFRVRRVTAATATVASITD